MTKSQVEIAIERAGSMNALAAQLDVSYQAIQKWIKSGYVPPARIPDFAKHTGIKESALYAEYHAKVKLAA